MPRLVVVLPLEPLHTGESFAVDHWPLHITVVAPFLTEAEPDVVRAIVAEATSTHHVFTVVAGGNAMFGRRENIPVALIEENEQLSHVHSTLVEALREVASSPDEPAFTSTAYRAHVTTKQGRSVNRGEALTLTQIAVVDMAPRADPSGRAVLGTIALTAG